MGGAIPSEALAVERERLMLRIAELRADHRQLLAAALDSNGDDEHDPEGATVGYERELLAAQVARAQARLADVDTALRRAAAGGYGRCVVCASPIDPARLAARPAATTCVRCADTRRR